LFKPRRAVKADYGNVMLHAANHCIQNRPKCAVVGQMSCPCTTRFNDDGQRKGLPESAFFNPYRLRSAVVCENEIVGSE